MLKLWRAALAGAKAGGGGRDRTADPRLMSPLLYQLSYTATAGVCTKWCVLRQEICWCPGRWWGVDLNAIRQENEQKDRQPIRSGLSLSKERITLALISL